MVAVRGSSTVTFFSLYLSSSADAAHHGPTPTTDSPPPGDFGGWKNPGKDVGTPRHFSKPPVGRMEYLFSNGTQPGVWPVVADDNHQAPHRQDNPPKTPGPFGGTPAPTVAG